MNNREESRWICLVVASKVDKIIENLKEIDTIEDHRSISLPTEKDRRLRDMSNSYILVKVCPTQRNLNRILKVSGVFRIMGRVVEGIIKPIYQDVEKFDRTITAIDKEPITRKNKAIEVGDSVVFVKGLFPGHTGLVLAKNDEYYLVSLLMSDNSRANLEVTEDYMVKSDV